MALQTATNPESGERLILIDNAWQPVEKSANNGAGAKAYLAGGKWHVNEVEASNEVPSATPVKQAAATAPRTPDRGVLDYVVGVPETIFTAGMGMARGAVAPFAAVAGEFMGGVNTPEGKAMGARAGQAVERGLAYTPKTQTANDIIDYAREKLEGIDLNAIPFAQGSAVAALAPAAVRQLPAAIKNEAGYLKNAVNEIPSVKLAREQTAAANVAQSYENASRIEAAQVANKYGIAIDPEVSNPTKSAKLRGAIVGERNVSNMMAEQNQPKITAALKEEVGISSTKKLDEATFSEAHAAPELTQPYEKIKAIPKVQLSPNTIDEIDSLKRTALMGEKRSDTLHIARRLDDLKADVVAGGDGNRFLTSVQQLRKEAQDIYRKKDPLTPLERREAEAIMGAADILETVLSGNLPFTKDRDAFLKARAGHAKLYQLEEATNLATGIPDARVFAKMIDDKKPITGVARDIGLVAANFPDVITPSGKGNWTIPRITRGTAPALIGSVLGGAVGNLPGAALGAAFGTAVGEFGKRRIAKNMLSPEFQAKNAVPTDYRPAPAAVNNLRPVESRALTVLPSAPRNNPNFIFSTDETTRFPFDPNRPDARQPITQGQTPAPVNSLRLGLDEAPEVTARLRAEDVRRARMAQSAEAQGLAAETSARAPTRGGMILDLDPVSGKLTPTSQGIRGATPETFQDYTATLRSAIDKMSSQSSTFTPTNTQKFRTGKFYETTTKDHVKGQPIYAYRQTSLTPVVEKGNRAFDLTAAEKVAFDKTKFYIAEVSPGFEKLSDKAIAERMMDRKWVEGAVAKARDQARAFDEIAQRAKTDTDIRAAQASREKMLDVAEMMEENLRPARPDNTRKQQGVKTREAFRNNMITNSRNKLGQE